VLQVQRLHCRAGMSKLPPAMGGTCCWLPTLLSKSPKVSSKQLSISIRHGSELLSSSISLFMPYSSTRLPFFLCHTPAPGCPSFYAILQHPAALLALV
jgi:hypothetical protein